MDLRPGVNEAFATFGATLENERFAYSALAPNGSVVVSCWSHRLVWGTDGGCVHLGHLSRWRENRIGARIFHNHLTIAWGQKRPLRLVVVAPGDTLKVDQSMNLDKMIKFYTAKPDLVGELAAFDGNDYRYDFKPASFIR